MGSYCIGAEVLGGWHITRLIGEGAFGRVFEVEKAGIGFTAKSALKVVSIPPSESMARSMLAEGMDQASIVDYFRGVVNDFAGEVALLSELSHPGIVSYQDHAIVPHEDGVGWDVLLRMELLDPLMARMEEGALPEAEVVRLGTELADALAYCHSQKIIHRDVKPSNIFADRNGRFKIGDFGVSRTVEHTTGMLSHKGTEAYMAPELFRAVPYGADVDVYALGLVLYQLLNGNRLPFLPPAPAPVGYHDREMAKARRLSGEALPALACAPELLAAVLAACSPDPAMRPSAEELRNALQRMRRVEQRPVSNSAQNSTQSFQAAGAIGSSVEQQSTVGVWGDSSSVSEKEARVFAEQDGRAAQTTTSVMTAQSGTVGIWGAFDDGQGIETAKNTNEKKPDKRPVTETKRVLWKCTACDRTADMDVVDGGLMCPICGAINECSSIEVSNAEQKKSEKKKPVKKSKPTKPKSFDPEEFFKSYTKQVASMKVRYAKRRIYFGDTLNVATIEKARECMGFPQGERVYLVYAKEHSLFGGKLKTGLACCDSGVYAICDRYVHNVNKTRFVWDYLQEFLYFNRGDIAFRKKPDSDVAAGFFRISPDGKSLEMRYGFWDNIDIDAARLLVDLFIRIANAMEEIRQTNHDDGDGSLGHAKEGGIVRPPEDRVAMPSGQESDASSGNHEHVFDPASIIQTYCQGNRPNSPYIMTPLEGGLKPKHEQQLRQYYQIPAHEQILLVYYAEATLFGPSKYGFALCTSGVYGATNDDEDRCFRQTYTSWEECAKQEVYSARAWFYVEKPGEPDPEDCSMIHFFGHYFNAIGKEYECLWLTRLANLLKDEIVAGGQ